MSPAFWGPGWRAESTPLARLPAECSLGLAIILKPEGCDKLLEFCGDSYHSGTPYRNFYPPCDWFLSNWRFTLPESITSDINPQLFLATPCSTLGALFCTQGETTDPKLQSTWGPKVTIWTGLFCPLFILSQRACVQLLPYSRHCIYQLLETSGNLRGAHSQGFGTRGRCCSRSTHRGGSSAFRPCLRNNRLISNSAAYEPCDLGKLHNFFVHLSCFTYNVQIVTS